MASMYPGGKQEMEAWDDVSPRLRSRWEERRGTRGGRWEDEESHYQYGWEMSSHPRYQGRAWSEVEPELRQDWETRYRDQPWDQAGQSVREVWEDLAEARTIQLREEELRARKQSVEAGAVEVRKEVVAENQTMNVPVTREEVVVERRAVDRRPAAGPIGEESVVEVPVYEEEVIPETRTVVREEVSLGKRQVQETERVSGTVRREEVEIETQGNVHDHHEDNADRYHPPRHR